MLYLFIIIAVITVLGSGISFHMYLMDRRARHASSGEHRPAQEVPSYTLSTWVDDEVAKRKLYRRPDLTGAELAEALGISEGRLRYAIAKGYSKSVADYLNDRRIQAACRLLREQRNRSEEDIFADVGFKSLYAFRMEFERTMGQTPEEYRRQMAI
jgi:AraC-like DNA-binding protein